MNPDLATTIAFLRAAYRGADLPAGRAFGDVYADRLQRAVTEPTLALAAEHLLRALHVSAEAVADETLTRLLTVASGSDASAVLSWLRGHTRLAAMLASVRDDHAVADALAEIALDGQAAADPGVALPAGAYAIPLRATCLSPLAHGADGKAGNATLFRRMHVLSTTHQTLVLPYYGGNAVRGQMRDLLADHFLSTLGLTPALWFFYALYSGGALEERSAALSAITKQLGDHGALRTQGLREFRRRVVPLSLLGCALGNRVLPGRVQVGDLRPACREWGGSEQPVATLMTWEYLTRREDYENHAENHSMIANTECLKPGVILHGGIDVDSAATPIERACLGLGIQLLAKAGRLGAENRRGLGRVVIEATNAPDPQPYLDMLVQDEQLIRDYLASVQATELPLPASGA
jgi:hypothetical protein